MATEITVRRFVRALLLEKSDKKDPIDEPHLEKPEKPLVISWSWQNPIVVCSEPRELSVKYGTILKKLGLKPGKSRHDHCWVKPTSERFRFSEKYMRSFAQKLMQAGANVMIEFEGKELLAQEPVPVTEPVTETRSLKEVFGINS